MTLSQVGWSGHVRTTVRCGGQLVATADVCNQITRVGRDLLRDALRGVVDPSPEITWVALGANADAASDEDLALGDERFRKQVTSQSVVGIGQLLTTMYVAESQANDFIIAEIGWFAGDATAAADSGTMIARVVVDPFSGSQKTALETLQVDRTDSLVEA